CRSLETYVPGSVAKVLKSSIATMCAGSADYFDQIIDSEFLQTPKTGGNDFARNDVYIILIDQVYDAVRSTFGVCNRCSFATMNETTQTRIYAVAFWILLIGLAILLTLMSFFKLLDHARFEFQLSLAPGMRPIAPYI